MCAWGKDQKVRRNERGLGGPCSRRAALKTLRRSLGGALRIPSLQHPCHLLPLLRRHRPSKLLRTGELRDPVLELPRPSRRRELRVAPYFCLISSTGVVQKSAMWPVLPHLKHSRAANAVSMSMGTGPLLFVAGAGAGRETDPPHGMKAGGLRQLLLLLRGAGLDAFDLGAADWLPARP